MWTLEDVIEQLNKHHQRATYGAVAGVVGKEAATLMNGRPRCHRDSWIVSKSTGRPTGYMDNDIDPICYEQITANLDNVIVDSFRLKQWLDTKV